MAAPCEQLAPQLKRESDLKELYRLVEKFGYVLVKSSQSKEGEGK